MPFAPSYIPQVPQRDPISQLLGGLIPGLDIGEILKGLGPPDWETGPNPYETTGDQLKWDIWRGEAGRPSRLDVLESIRKGDTKPDQFNLEEYGIDPGLAGKLNQYYGNMGQMPTREQIIQSIMSGETRADAHPLRELGIDPNKAPMSNEERQEMNMSGWVKQGADKGGQWRDRAGRDMAAARLAGNKEIAGITERMIADRKSQGAKSNG